MQVGSIKNDRLFKFISNQWFILFLRKTIFWSLHFIWRPQIYKISFYLYVVSSQILSF